MAVVMAISMVELLVSWWVLELVAQWEIWLVAAMVDGLVISKVASMADDLADESVEWMEFEKVEQWGKV